MPLPPGIDRQEIHHRQISMTVWHRADGLFDVEAHLVDAKTFEFHRMLSGRTVAAGEPVHDLWVRLTVDAGLVVRAVQAASDVTPFDICPQATDTLSVLVGERIGPGWSRIVRERLRGAASCTHLAELMLPMATTALQGIRAVLPRDREPTDADGRPHRIDSCYAFDARRDVVKVLWPAHHRLR